MSGNFTSRQQRTALSENLYLGTTQLPARTQNITQTLTDAVPTFLSQNRPTDSYVFPQTTQEQENQTNANSQTANSNNTLNIDNIDSPFAPGNAEMISQQQNEKWRLHHTHRPNIPLRNKTHFLAFYREWRDWQRSFSIPAHFAVTAVLQTAQLDTHLKRSIIDQYPQLHQPTPQNGVQLWTLLWKVLCTRFCTNEFVKYYESQFKGHRLSYPANPTKILNIYRALWNQYEDAFKLTKSTFPEYTSLQPITTKYYIKKIMGALRAANIQYYNYVFQNMGSNPTVEKFEELVDECNNRFHFNPYAYVRPKLRVSNDRRNFENKQRKTHKQFNTRWNKNKDNKNKEKITTIKLRCYKCTGKHYTSKCTLPKTITCNKCGLQGHIARACKNTRKEIKNNQNTQNNTDQPKENTTNNKGAQNKRNNKNKNRRWNNNKHKGNKKNNNNKQSNQ